MVYADDDSWLAGGVELPPTGETYFIQSNAYAVASLSVALGSDADPAGYHQYKYATPNQVDEKLYRDCYYAGHGPPIKYTRSADLWNSIDKRVISLEPEDIWCSIPDENYEVSSDVLDYDPELVRLGEAVILTMQLQYGKPSTTHGTSNGWTFPVGDTNHIHKSIETFPKPAVRWNSDLHEFETIHVTKMRAHFPYNRENARDTAVRKIKQAMSTHRTVEFCEQWNIVSAGGVEYKEMPEYIHTIGESFDATVVNVLGKYPVELKLFDEEGGHTWVKLDHTNMDEILNGIKDLWLTNDPNINLRNHLWNVNFQHRLSCEDYGYEHLVIGECDDAGVKEYVGLHPSMHSDGNNLCRSKSGVKVYIYDAGRGTSSANVLKDLIRFGGDPPTVISQYSEMPDKRLFCKKNHNLDPVQTDHHASMSYKYSLEQIHNAHMAVMTWAHVNCKKRDGTSFTSSSSFSCLLGANDIQMKGPSWTIPLGFGFAPGWTTKNAAKVGLSFIVKGKYSFCVHSQETAKMQGPKLSWKPAVFVASTAKAKDLLKEAASDVKTFRKALGRQMKKENPLRKPSNLFYDEKNRGWGKATKYAVGNVGRETTNFGVQSVSKNTGIPLKFEVEYWMEEGSCSLGDCKLKTDVYSWDMIAASVSFFSASASVSYIRVYKTGYESDVPDTGILNSVGGNVINSGVLSFFQGPSEGWDRYLIQLKASIQVIPNLGQIASNAYGAPLGPKANTKTYAGWKAEQKKALSKSAPKKKFKLKSLLPELVISLEKAHGQGHMVVSNSHGFTLAKNPDWYDFHGGNMMRYGDRIRYSHFYWEGKHIKAMQKKQPFQPLVSCGIAIDPNDPDSLLFNRFRINSKCNSAHPNYMPVFAPVRESQFRIPVTHKSYTRPPYASRGILIKKETYNKPDIALSDDTKLQYKPTTKESDPYAVVNEKLNYVNTLDLSQLGNLRDSYIHGLSDTLEENANTMNPWAVTNANEHTAELKVKKPVYQFLTLENCDAFGLTSIRHMSDDFNSFLGNYIFPGDSTWKFTINNNDFVETTITDDGIQEKEIDNIHASPVRPYGLIVSGPRDGKPLVYRQTERYLFGQESETSGIITKHLDCRPDYRCICLGPSEYLYTTYSSVTRTNELMQREDLIMHPVDIYQECKIAQQHQYEYNQENFDDTGFKDISFYMNKRYEGPGVKVVRTATLGAGCIIYGGKVVFNDHRDAIFNPNVALVKILKLKMRLDDAYDYANGDHEYQRVITRKNTRGVPDIVKANLDTAYATRVSLNPKENHDIKQVQLIHQDNVLKYFPMGEQYEALKDTSATHMLYHNKVHSWRFVDQYMKTNKQKVEVYAELDGRPRTIQYLDMNDHVWNDWDASVNPEGKADYSFVQNLGSYVTTTNEVVVPEVDFIADRKVSFHGKNIPMKENEAMTHNTDNSIPTHGASCEVSLMLPNRCPAGYGMDGDKIGTATDVYGVPYKYGNKRQCALCPTVDTCKGQCANGYTKVCLDCLSPEGHYRCQIDVTKCDKPGYVWVTTHRGGKRGHLTGHCVKTDLDPKEEHEWHTTNLQKEYWDRGEPFFPHRWEKDGISYIRNEKSDTRYLTCDPGYVPVKAKNTHECSDASYTTQASCEAESLNTWNRVDTCSGYMCEKCPPTYIEENQICVKCGHRQVANATNQCEDVEVPEGHFFDSQNQAGGSVSGVVYPFASHCDYWLNHPAGAIGAYQDKRNELVCKTSNTTHTRFGEHAVLFKGGIVKFWSTPGIRVNSDRTAVVSCKEYEVCNGEEITGCKPGYIWAKQTPDKRDDQECFPCNDDQTILNDHVNNSVHGERDNYEYCDGTHMLRCADASYTDAYEKGFSLKVAGIHNDLFVGVRSSWVNSSLLYKHYDRFAFTNWNKIPFQEDSSGEKFITFKVNAWGETVQGDHKAHWRSFQGREGKRGIELYEYDSGFQTSSLRVVDNEKFNNGAKCYPVPDGFFALPNEWEKKGCGFSEELCVHRTFHDVIPYKPICPDAKKHFLSNAVKEDCYDYIYRWEDRICTDGLLPGGCNKEYCTREGQSNCWCGDEEDFCTMGCVNGMCQEICGDRVCKEYELCYGEFNAIKSFAQCVIKCQEPKSNYCLWENEHGNTVYCRHFNKNFNIPPLNTSYPDQKSPCFDEMPNIPEMQCKDTFDSECFCGRTFLENSGKACVDKQLRNFCDVLQDDGTCTYETSDDGTCICGDVLVDTKRYERCYAYNNKCGPQARAKQVCNAILEDEEFLYIRGCQPSGGEAGIEYCAKADSIIKEYVDITQEPNLRCVGTEVAEIEGCVDPQGKNYNNFATIPKKCQY